MTAKKVKLKYKFKRIQGDEFLDEIVNPKGTKKGVYIYQGEKPGFSAGYIKSHRTLPGSSKDAEALAIRLARKGHKKVIFHD